MKAVKPYSKVVEIASAEWEAAQRLPYEERLDYIYRVCSFSHFRQYHYKVRKIDIEIL